MDVKLRYDAPPTIARFMRSDGRIRIVVGPFGSGKSSGCVMEILRRAISQVPGPDGIRRSRWAIIRNTRPQLRDTTRKTFEQWFPFPSGVGDWHENPLEYRLRFPLKDGTSIDCEVLFRALDRPEDVRNLLSLEITGAYLNEAREISKSIFDALQGRIGRYPSKMQGGASWRGIWGDSNPWHKGHWAEKLFRRPPPGFELYRQPGGRSEGAENVENLPPGYYEDLVAGKDSEWVKVYIDGQDAAGDIGSIWSEQVAALESHGGITEFAHPKDGVFTSWDLGYTDSTAIWFWRINEHGVPDVIDHYEANGKPLSHFFDAVDALGYKYVKHWLPHDARARTLATGSSVQEQFNARYGAGAVAIGPELSIADGLQAARWMLEQEMRIHSRCEAGIEALKEYRYEWDEEERVFSRRPLHNWASHTADAFRYLALVVKHSDLMTRPEPAPPVEPIARPAHLSFNLDELYEARAQAASGRRSRV